MVEKIGQKIVEETAKPLSNLVEVTKLAPIRASWLSLSKLAYFGRECNWNSLTTIIIMTHLLVLPKGKKGRDYKTKCIWSHICVFYLLSNFISLGT
jgi:hypothetical protein